MRLCISASQLGLPAIPNKHAARHLTLPAIKIGQISAIFDDCSIRSSRTTYQSLGPLPHYMLAVKKLRAHFHVLCTAGPYAIVGSNPVKDKKNSIP